MGAWPGNEEAAESPSPTPEPLPTQVASRHRDLVAAVQRREGETGRDGRGAAAHVSSTAVEVASAPPSRAARFTSPPLDLVEAPRFGSSVALPPTSVLASHTTTQIREAITALRLARAQGVDVSSLALNDDLRAALVAIGSGAHVAGFPDAELQALLREVTSRSRGVPRPTGGVAREASELPTSRATEIVAAPLVEPQLGQEEPGNSGGVDSDDSGSVGQDAVADTPVSPQEPLAPPFDALPPPAALVSWQDVVNVGGSDASGGDPDLLHLGVQPVDDDSVSVSGSDQEESEGGADVGSSSADGVAWHTEPELRPLAPSDQLDPLAPRCDKPLSPKQRVLSASKSAKPVPSATVVASGPPSVAPPPSLSQQRSLHSRGGAAGNNSVAGGASLASATMHGSVGHLLRHATSRRIPVARIASRVMMQPPPEVLAAEEEALKVRAC